MDTEKKDILILAIESSCDETAAAVVKNGRQVLSNVISSQIDLHKLYGGVVPEIASRKHIEKINQVIEEALENAGVTLDDIDAIGVTYGPVMRFRFTQNCGSERKMVFPYLVSSRHQSAKPEKVSKSLQKFMYHVPVNWKLFGDGCFCIYLYIAVNVKPLEKEALL